MIISKSHLYQLIREEVMTSIEENPPWSDDEIRERRISHAADKEANKLIIDFMRDLKRDVGRYWGDNEKEIQARREVESRAAAYKSYLPNLDNALAMKPGNARDDRVKHVVYVLDSLQPRSYEPSEEEKTIAYGDPLKAGGPSPRKLSGTIPSLGIDLADA